MPPITVSRGEFAVASEIMTEAAEWLVATGQPLWQLAQVSDDALRARCDPASVIVGYAAREAVVAAVLEWRDDVFWPGHEDAGFVHRLAVRRRAAAQGYASALLDWAAEESAAHGKAYLCLDCLADRPRLCAFYERCGFERVGTWTSGTGQQNALYRRAARKTAAY